MSLCFFENMKGSLSTFKKKKILMMVLKAVPLPPPPNNFQYLVKSEKSPASTLLWTWMQTVNKIDSLSALSIFLFEFIPEFAFC